MSDFLSTLASQAGIDTGMAQKGVGALLATLQQHVPAEAFSKVSAAIPNASGILSGFQSGSTATKDSGLGGIAGIAGKMLGGDAAVASTLVSQFSKAGFSADAMKAFLPVVLGLLKDKLPPEVMKLVGSVAPGAGDASAGPDILGSLKKLF